MALSGGSVGAWLVSGQLSGQRVELANVTNELAAVGGERDRLAVIAESIAADLGSARRDLAASAGAWLLFADHLDAAARALDEPWQGVLASPRP